MSEVRNYNRNHEVKCINLSWSCTLSPRRNTCILSIVVRRAFHQWACGVMDSPHATRLASNQKIAGSSPARLVESFFRARPCTVVPGEMTPNSDVVGERGLRC